jgi:SAM-dependent methyltransferase
MLSRLVGIGNGRRFLDYGCGGGHFVAAAVELGFEAVGMELDRVSVNAGRSRGLDIREVRTASGELPAGETFDVILIFHVLEHIAAPRQVVANLRGHLRRGGTLVIGVPDQDSFPSLLKRSLRGLGIKRSEYGFVQPPIHLIGFNKRSLQALGASLELECLRLSRENAVDPDNFPVGRSYWGNMPLHKAIYAIGALLGSGGHLMATFGTR